MPLRFTIAFVPVRGVPARWSVGLSPAEKPDAKDQPPNPKLEPKNFIEKVKGFKSIIDANTKTTTKVDMKEQFEMVYVRGGEVTVGSPESEEGRQSNEGPQYKAKVGNFWMQKFEVTWNDWDVFWYDENYLKADHKDAAKFGPDAITRPTNTFLDETYDHGRDGHPAISMTHHAAMMYCEWLRKKTGQAVPPADRGRVGVRRPRGEGRHRLLLRQRSASTRRLRVVQGELARRRLPRHDQGMHAQGRHAQGRTRSASTTCTATSGNGRWTNTIRRPTRRAQRTSSTCCR